MGYVVKGGKDAEWTYDVERGCDTGYRRQTRRPGSGMVLGWLVASCILNSLGTKATSLGTQGRRCYCSAGSAASVIVRVTGFSGTFTFMPLESIRARVIVFSPIGRPVM